MAKFCNECGMELDDAAKFCDKCGTKCGEVKEATVTTTEQAPVAEAKKGNTVALVGFIVAICNILLCCGSISTISLVLCIVGIVQAKKFNGDKKGLAIAGLIMTAIMMIINLLVVIFIYIPALTQISEEGGSWGDQINQIIESSDSGSYWDDL